MRKLLTVYAVINLLLLCFITSERINSLEYLILFLVTILVALLLILRYSLGGGSNGD